MPKHTTKSVPNAHRASPPFQAKLFWPMLALLVVLPVVAWELASEDKGGEIKKTEPVALGNPGPWGNLEYVRIDIEIPDHFANPDQAEPTDWFFRGFTRDKALDVLKKCRLSES